MTSGIVELIKELDAKIKQIVPDGPRPKPPATLEDLRTAERLHGAELTDELAAVAQIRNGCTGYPMFQGQFGLASCLDDLNLAYPFPNSGGPFEERSTAIFAGVSGQTYLLTPLTGEYRGHVFRMSFDGYYSCYAASSISEVVADWIFYLDHGLLVKTPNADELVPKGSVYHVIEGPEAIGAALAAVPAGNPIVLDHIFDETDPVELALLRERQEPFGIDPRLDPRHPDHGQWQHETEQQRAVQLASAQAWQTPA